VHAVRVFDWRHAGALAAGMAFVVEGTTATYHLGWAGQAAKDAGMHPLMLMRAAQALREEGVRWLDLGSIDTENAPSLARFKLGTGAAVKRLGATMLVVPG
jgi:lipid II:glycine glycyltransferase (peptidoglycan interpeptide bridge formation enzyme)